MQFHTPYLQLFQENGWKTAVAARNDYETPSECHIPFCDAYFDVPFCRNPFGLANMTAYRKLKQIIAEGDYDIIHCHTPVAAFLTRLAARKARKHGTRVIYTAHGFHFYKGAPLKNWLFYYPIEWLCAHWTDTLITINREDETLARAHMHAKEVVYVPGVGIDLSRFSPAALTAAEKVELRTSLGLLSGEKMLLSVGELIPRKNHRAVIRALAQMKNIPWKYYICGSGALASELAQLIRELDLTNRVFLLGYRADIPALCNCADLFIFPSLQEGLPVALMEAIACGAPVICSAIRGSRELVQDGQLFAAGDDLALSHKLSDCVANAPDPMFVKRNLENLESYQLENVKRQMAAIYGLS